MSISKIKYYWSVLAICLGLILLFSCHNAVDENASAHADNHPIALYSNREPLNVPAPLRQPLPPYPWRLSTPLPITKYHFRCKGAWEHPLRPVEQQGKKIYLTDCASFDSHSLPLRDGSEFIYPILIDLLNYLQQQTGSKVIITSGHRCPEHHTYIDPHNKDPYSKHLTGAAVDFYIEAATKQPEKIVSWIQSYYRQRPDTYQDEAFTRFERYEKSDTDVSTPPWYNKEVFIKLYQAHEGRNDDNNHSYPYISIQVRWDRERRERVVYSWQQAYENYYRY
jgi:hypothetical protein